MKPRFPSGYWWKRNAVASTAADSFFIYSYLVFIEQLILPVAYPPFLTGSFSLRRQISQSILFTLPVPAILSGIRSSASSTHRSMEPVCRCRAKDSGRRLKQSGSFSGSCSSALKIFEAMPKLILPDSTAWIRAASFRGPVQSFEWCRWFVQMRFDGAQATSWRQPCNWPQCAVNRIEVVSQCLVVGDHGSIVAGY